jgi:hypothetical protein
MRRAESSVAFLTRTGERLVAEGCRKTGRAAGGEGRPHSAAAWAGAGAAAAAFDAPISAA